MIHDIEFGLIPFTHVQACPAGPVPERGENPSSPTEFEQQAWLSMPGPMFSLDGEGT